MDAEQMQNIAEQEVVSQDEVQPDAEVSGENDVANIPSDIPSATRELIRNFIYAAVDGKAEEIEDNLQTVMAYKALDAINQRFNDVAASLFQKPINGNAKQ